MNEFETFQSILAICITAFMFPMNFMGFTVRPIDFLLFFGSVGLLVDIFRMVVMRGNNDD